jgi:branched-chain amino acid aminotransferase
MQGGYAAVRLTWTSAASGGEHGAPAWLSSHTSPSFGDDCRVQATDKIWVNGELVDWADACFHVTAHSLHYGTGVFEGIRCYPTESGPAVFRLSDHLQRLADSARLCSMQLPYTTEQLRRATLDLIAENELPGCYVRPIAFFGSGELTVYPGSNPVEMVIIAWPWGAYLGEAGQREGIGAMTSSWTRVGPNTIPHVAKASGVYLNSMLATQAAKRAGYEEAILLTDGGVVADGPGENVFVVKDGVVRTPPLSTSILPGVTRATVMRLARDLGYTVEERNLIRTDLYLADEVFMTGTAAEVTPVRAVDDHELGAGQVTLELQQAYWDAVHGRSESYLHWLDFVRMR